MTQQKMFDEETLEKMVDEGRVIMSKKFIELNLAYNNSYRIDDYIFNLLIHDIQKGYYDNNKGMQEFDNYINHIKKVSKKNVEEAFKMLKKDIGDPMFNVWVYKGKGYEV